MRREYDENTTRVQQEYDESTTRLRREYDEITTNARREYDETTTKRPRDSNESALRILREYSENTTRIRREYDESTLRIRREYVDWCRHATAKKRRHTLPKLHISKPKNTSTEALLNTLQSTLCKTSSPKPIVQWQHPTSNARAPTPNAQSTPCGRKAFLSKP